MIFLEKILRGKSHALAQFFKYVLCGGVAMLSDMVVFFLAAWLVVPCLTADEGLVRLFDLDVPTISDSVRTFRFCVANGLAFIVSNLVAYLLNVRFVFARGRHGRVTEIALFYLVSAVSVGLGTAGGALLIRLFGLSTSVSYVAKVVATTLINFAARKFIIFKG